MARQAKKRPAPERPWFNLEGAAEYVGLHPVTFRALVRGRKVKFTRVTDKPHSELRFHQDWLDQYLSGHATEPTVQ